MMEKEILPMLLIKLYLKINAVGMITDAVKILEL
jgi:hypothetical protein